MERRAKAIERALNVLGGFALLVVAIAGFAGWPRPFDPDTGWLLLFMVVVAVTMLWRGSAKRAWSGVSLALAVLTLVLAILALAGAPWFS